MEVHILFLKHITPLFVLCFNLLTFYNTFSDPKFPWDVSFKEFPHPPGDVYNEVTLSAMVFFMAVAIFGFVFQVSALITEKELKLRQVIPISIRIQNVNFKIELLNFYFFYKVNSFINVAEISRKS